MWDQWLLKMRPFMKVSTWELKPEGVNGIHSRKLEGRRQFLGVNSVVYISVKKGVTTPITIKIKFKIFFFFILILKSFMAFSPENIIATNTACEN